MFSKRPTAKIPGQECRVARTRLQTMQDGELRSEELLPLQSHLAICERCACEARELQSLATLLHHGGNPPHQLPSGAALVGRILEQSARPTRRPLGFTLAIPAVGALAAAIILLPNLLVQLPHPTLQPGPPPIATVATAQASELVVLDDERLGRQVLLAPNAAGVRHEEGLSP